MPVVTRLHEPPESRYPSWHTHAEAEALPGGEELPEGQDVQELSLPPGEYLPDVHVTQLSVRFVAPWPLAKVPDGQLMAAHDSIGPSASLKLPAGQGTQPAEFHYRCQNCG